VPETMTLLNLIASFASSRANHLITVGMRWVRERQIVVLQLVVLPMAVLLVVP
jgi:hypothetical protein